MGAKENRAGVAHFGRQRFRVRGHDLQVLGGNRVRELDRLVELVDHDDGAEIACAPPTRYISETPPRCAAASTSGLSLPSGDGTTITTRSTPATLAGTAFISTEDG